MMTTSATPGTTSVEDAVRGAIDALDLDATCRTYHEQNELIWLERWLPAELVDALVAEAEALRPELHRNYIPRHKKGGSVSYHVLRERAPAIMALYRSPALLALLGRLSGAESLELCPETDPHAAALYYYTEPGDHIGWHRDTSYYRGARYTVLVGLIERSSSRLQCRIHAGDPARETREVALATEPGTFVAFHGDKLLHRVTPLGADEERVVLTLEYVTDPRMGRFKRFVSNMKDAIAYFGIAGVFGGRRRAAPPGPS